MPNLYSFFRGMPAIAQRFTYWLCSVDNILIFFPRLSYYRKDGAYIRS